MQCVFDNMDSSWVLTRPILAILLSVPSSFDWYKTRLLQAQSLPASAAPEMAAKIQRACEELMDGVDPVYDHASKDRFMTNLMEFKMQITAFCSRPA